MPCAPFHLSLFFLLLAFSCPALSATVKVAGSDTLGPPLQDFFAGPDQASAGEYTFDFAGSRLGLFAVRAGEADVALITLPPGESAPAQPLVARPFAYLATVVVVNAKNPLTQIRLNRLGGIFGTGEEFDFNQWGDLGLSTWTVRSIQAVALRSQGDLSSEIYRNLGLRTRQWKNTVSFVSGTSQLLDKIRTDEGAIGLMPGLPQAPGVKVLALLDDRRESGVFPDSDSLYTGQYPLGLTFYLIYQAQNLEKLRPFLQRLLSSELAAHLTTQGFLPLPDSIRERSSMEIQLARP